MAFTIRPADIIKARVIDFLIEHFDGVVIGNEVKYGSNHKIVDLLALYKDETYAIEIKSKNDDLRRLPEQLSDYEKIFDHTIVFATNEHIKKISEVANIKVSVYEISEGGKVEGGLRTKKNSPLKSEMLATMNSQYIRKHLGMPNTKDSDGIRKSAMRLKREKIHSMLYDYFKEKLSTPYELFLNERGSKTEIDDISILSNRLKVD